MVKTNNIEELLKAKGISTAKKKKTAKADYGQNIKRLYNIEAEPEPYPTLPLETEHKSNTNQTQSEHKPNTSRHKVDTNRTQSGHVQTQTEHKLDTNRAQTEHAKNTNRTQSGHKPNTDLSISALVGLQRKVLIFFFQDCKNRRSKTTQEMTVQHIAEHQNITFGSVKTTIMRLEQKGYIKRFMYKNGRGGWASFEIPDPVYQELLQYEDFLKLDTNRTQTEHKVDTKLNTNSPYSSSNIINTTTTDPEIVIPKELQDMGVSIKSLTAYLVNMTAQELQQSIDAFNYDLMNNLVKSSTPLNMLFGILKKGRPYLSSHFTEQLNRDVAEAIKRSEEVEQKHKALEEANFKARFYEWRLNNKEEADRLLATSGLGSRSEKIAESFLMGEFRKLEAPGGIL